jgi:hypothetical protein
MHTSADNVVTILHARNDIGALFTNGATLGELNGFNLARITRTMYPHLAVLVVSGRLPEGFSGVAPDARLISKPYRIRDVAQLIRKMTEG